jgi:hypothetical protein
VSDLFLAGDVLFATSTLPDGPPCGSVWRIPLGSPNAAPVKLDDFEGFKPEGVARDATGRLLVLFDTGDAPPRLATLATARP